MKDHNIFIYPTLEDVSSALAAEINKRITELSIGKQKVTIALSGSSTPQVLFRHLAQNYKDVINWNIIHLFWVDERCVPPDHEQSNYGAARKSLINNIPIPAENVHRIRGEEDPETEAKLYSDEVLATVETKNALPSFNIILLGIGDDGHTASIFPDQMDLLETSEIYAHSKHPLTGQSRITMTGTVINNADFIYNLVSGSSKKKIVKTLIKKEAEAAFYPANYIRPVNNNLIWYLDSAAAGEII